MKMKFAITILVIIISFIGCGSDDDNITNTTGNTVTNQATINLSGAAIGNYDAEVGLINDGESVTISVGDKNGNLGFILSSKKVQTGTFSIPDEYEILFSNSLDTTMVDFHSGTVKIDEISTLAVKGSFTGKGYPMKLNTFEIDSTKTVNATVTFQLN